MRQLRIRFRKMVVLRGIKKKPLKKLTVVQARESIAWIEGEVEVIAGEIVFTGRVRDINVCL